MSAPKVAVPLFPTPPREYSQRYMADMQRTFAQFAQAILTPGEGRNTFLVLTALPSDDVGLEAGSLYKDGNTVKISVLNIAAVRGASLEASVGDVTVVT